MKNFAGASLKPTWLFGNSPKLNDLVSRTPVITDDMDAPETFRNIESKSSGKKQVEGGKGLKGTEAYPTEFGKAIADAYLDDITVAPQGDGVALTELNTIPCSDDPWEDAGLDDVIQSLSQAIARDTPA